MIRFFVACLFYTTIARWGYAEISLIFPQAMPFVNQSIQKITIPTHNTWSRDALHEYADKAGDTLETVAEALVDLHSFLDDQKDRSGY